MTYDEGALKSSLDHLPAKLQSVFAALCAERLAPAYPPFAMRNRRPPMQLAKLLAKLWQDLLGLAMTREDLQASLDESVALVPDDDDTFVGVPFYASDAAAAVAYAFSARLTGDAQEAAWAARRAYEALDHFVTPAYEPGIEPAPIHMSLIAHPLVEEELARQRRDLKELRTLSGAPLSKAILQELRARAQTEAYAFLGSS
jgi:hypothetical protein